MSCSPSQVDLKRRHHCGGYYWNGSFCWIYQRSCHHLSLCVVCFVLEVRPIMGTQRTSPFIVVILPRLTALDSFVTRFVSRSLFHSLGYLHSSSPTLVESHSAFELTPTWLCTMRTRSIARVTPRQQSGCHSRNIWRLHTVAPARAGDDMYVWSCETVVVHVALNVTHKQRFSYKKSSVQGPDPCWTRTGPSWTWTNCPVWSSEDSLDQTWSPVQGSAKILKNQTELDFGNPTTKIPLGSLFVFLEDPSAPSEMEYFWRGGIQNLDKEMEVHKILCLGQECQRDGLGYMIKCYPWCPAAVSENSIAPYNWSVLYTHFKGLIISFRIIRYYKKSYITKI